MTTMTIPRQSFLALADQACYSDAAETAEAASVACSTRGFFSRLKNWLPGSEDRFQLVGLVPAEIRETVRRTNGLLALQDNWDSYGGRRLSRIAASASLRWLQEEFVPGLPPPSVIPGSDGSVQLEWHTRGIDLEVNFAPDGAATFVGENRPSEGIAEGDATRDIAELRRFIKALAPDGGR